MRITSASVPNRPQSLARRRLCCALQQTGTSGALQASTSPQWQLDARRIRRRPATARQQGPTITMQGDVAMTIFNAYQARYEAAREEEMSLQE
ncbi:MAG: hypothetical protein JSR40_00230, partial [Proteobacteria bacterium]|nr:hypothetical protein [Pseudomonadota bacterium]